MPSADRTYVDPSALRSLYVHDDRSARFCAFRKRLGGSLPMTRLGRAELTNSIQLAVHRRLVGISDARGAIQDLEDDVVEGRLALVDAPWRRVFDLAAALVAQHTPALGARSLDVLHVATAVTLGLTHFVSYDRRQLALAKAAGRRLLSP